MSLRAVAIATVTLQAIVIVTAGTALSHQTRKVKAFQQCTAEVGAGSVGLLASAKICPPAIAQVHTVAVHAQACEAALSAKPENTYGVGAYCSTPVKTLQAERDVARSEARRLTADLQNERLGRDDAISRATVAATTQAERKARAAAAVQAAPRDGDGLVVCDAKCVRARWPDAAPERP